MKECELCSSRARMYCESDEASLCWSCDVKVHSANFLVARHTRILLCNSCQSPTPWKASGSKLGQTISICDRCVHRCKGKQEKVEQDVNDDENQGPDDDEDEESDDENDEEEEGENQVVPFLSDPNPPIMSYSSSVEESSTVSLKRMRDQNFNLSSQDDLDSTDYNPNSKLTLLKRTMMKMKKQNHQSPSDQ